jgi:hypothetical protein
VQLAPGALVGVMWIDGNPARPVVVLADTTLPTSVSFQALEQAGISAPLLNVGNGGFDPVALAPPLQTWATAVVAQLAAAHPPITVPPLDGGVAATRLKAS